MIIQTTNGSGNITNASADSATGYCECSNGSVIIIHGKMVIVINGNNGNYYKWQ